MEHCKCRIGNHISRLTRLGVFFFCLLPLLLETAVAQPNDSRPLTGEAEIMQTWHGDYPLAQINRLPEGQRNLAVGYINDAVTFNQIWQAFMPGETAPQIDFRNHLVLFVRNTRFYNRISIGKVKVTDGMAEVLAMETKSAMPIEDKVAMSLAVIARKGIVGLTIGDETILIEN